MEDKKIYFVARYYGRGTIETVKGALRSVDVDAVFQATLAGDDETLEDLLYADGVDDALRFVAGSRYDLSEEGRERIYAAFQNDHPWAHDGEEELIVFGADKAKVPAAFIEMEAQTQGGW